MALEISTILWSFFLTLLMGVIIITTAKYHGRWSHDGIDGVQKFHDKPTPRVGGLAIFFGVVSGFFAQADGPMREDFLPVVICACIPFLNGIREDLLKAASVRERMLSIVLASLAVITVTGVTIHRVDLPVIDQLLSIHVVAILFTLLAVTGVTNAINIIDGFNGLASGVSLYIFLFFTAIALNVGDADIAELSMILAIALFAFMLLNFPFGKIFLGDSGAYFVGFYIAWLALMLPERNPSVSPWAPLVICAYPVTEVIYSMFRRIKAKMVSTQPDNAHLHSLIKTRIVRRFFYRLPSWLRNSIVSPMVWMSNLMLGLLGVIYQGRTPALVVIFILFVVVYVATHMILVRMPEYDGLGRRVEQNGN